MFAVQLGLLFLDHHPVVHGDPGVLKTQGLGELVLIHAELRQPDASNRFSGYFVVRDGLGPDEHPAIAYLGDALTEKVSGELALTCYYVEPTDHLRGITA